MAARGGKGREMEGPAVFVFSGAKNGDLRAESKGACATRLDERLKLELGMKLHACGCREGSRVGGHPPATASTAMEAHWG